MSRPRPKYLIAKDPNTGVVSYPGEPGFPDPVSSTPGYNTKLWSDGYNPTLSRPQITHINEGQDTLVDPGEYWDGKAKAATRLLKRLEGLRYIAEPDLLPPVAWFPMTETIAVLCELSTRESQRRRDQEGDFFWYIGAGILAIMFLIVIVLGVLHLFLGVGD